MRFDFSIELLRNKTLRQFVRFEFSKENSANWMELFS